MYLLAAIFVLEVGVALAAASELLPSSIGEYAEAIVILAAGLSVISGALLSVERDKLIDDLAYLVGLGAALSHGVRNVEVYDALYTPGAVGLALILVAYLVMPLAVALAPWFVLWAPPWEREGA